ncbi:MAG: DUF255 domain-containing protein [bacterium]|nr:DUF255 domain-containing protein [bacterium]
MMKYGVRPQIGPAWFAVAMVFMTAAAFAQPGGPSPSFEVLTASDGVSPGSTQHVAVQVTFPEPWHVNANKPLEEFLIPTVLSVETPDGMVVTETVYPVPKDFKFEGSDELMHVYGGTFPIGLAVGVGDGVAPGDYALKGSLRYQACNDTQCWAPASTELEIVLKVVAEGQPVVAQHEDVFADIAFTGGDTSAPTGESSAELDPTSEGTGGAVEMLSRFTIAGQAGGYMKGDEFLAFIDAAESGLGQTQAGFLQDKSLWVVVVITLVGGLLLNLTPCVLPIIPINLAIIGAGAQSGSRARGLFLGGLYGAGIALLYGVLGLVVVLGVSSFGAINASPWFNFGIAVIFVLLGLALFDLFLIDFTRFQGRLGIKPEKGSFVFAFIMGMINALLAGACVAPVVIMVVLYSQDAYAKGSVIGLVLPFLLGVGMALPWPLAGAGLAFLPKPGKWMVYVKYVFGVFIIVMGVYYGYLGATLFSDRYLVDPEAVQQSAETLDEEGWTSSLENGLAQAEAEGKPVLVDFWATWCKNCLTMNKTTLRDPAVANRLEGYVKVKYQAETPDQAPAKDVLARFEYIGLPHYAILKPGT